MTIPATYAHSSSENHDTSHFDAFNQFSTCSKYPYGAVSASLLCESGDIYHSFTTQIPSRQFGHIIIVFTASENEQID